MRVGQKQKKIDINIPKLDDFIHKVYVNVARKVYKNVYLFEINIPPLQIQKHNRELEIIIQECILNTLRESIPVEAILKAYMDETVEEDVIEDIKEEIITEPIIKNNLDESEKSENKSKLSFNNLDYTKDINNNVSTVNAPKSIERLEEISEMRNNQRKLESEDDDEPVKLNISEQNISLDNLDVHVIDEPKIELFPDLLLDDIEILE
jgi:hypothetical protein